jgi:hypothetical protein
MKARIKNIPVGTEFGSVQFLARMMVDGIHYFIPVDQYGWEGWYFMGFPDPTHGCVYPKEWLEIIEEDDDD